MSCLKKSAFRLPLGRVNCLSPLGHSGQRRLQAVVGSMLTVIGSPQLMGFFKSLVSWKLVTSLAAFQVLARVSLDKKLKVSRLYSGMLFICTSQPARYRQASAGKIQTRKGEMLRT